jgi:hypothetical protein
MKHAISFRSLPVGLLVGILFGLVTEGFGQRIRASWFDINPSQSNTDAQNPNGSSGGRIQHLGATSDLRQVFAASEWGGLWTSFNQGLSWVKVNSFVPSATWDVKVDPRNNRRIFATSLYDGRANTRIRRSLSGISISTDGGVTWRNAPLPPVGTCAVANRRTEPSAFQIAINQANPSEVFVGTNCGLAHTTDNGANWVYIDPSPADPAEQIYNVIIPANNIVDIIGDNGHFRSIDGGTTWTTAVGLGIAGGINGSLAASPVENYVLFAINPANLRPVESDDGGQTWPTTLTLPASASQPQGRIPFVRTNLRTSNQFDLWYGDTQLFRTTATTPGSPAPGGTARAPLNNWFAAQNGAHWDVGDLLFDPRSGNNATPLLFANDGGVYRNLDTRPDNPTWEQPDVTPHATWLFGFDGTTTGTPGQHALYYGLQDNGSWGTVNLTEGPLGTTPNWNNNVCCDVFDDAAQSDLIVYNQGRANTGRGFRLYRRGPNFAGGAEIPNYPSSALFNGFTTGHEVVRFANNAFALTFTDGVHITSNINNNPISWSALGAPPGGAGGGLKAALVNGAPNLYVHTGSGNTNGPGQIFRRPSTTAGGWAQLSLPPNIVNVTVYDVDPTNGNRLIISGIDGTNNFSMWRTSDFGATWTQLNGLNTLMTGGGVFQNRANQGPLNFTAFGTYWQPSMVEFNPNTPNTVIAGAVDAGVFISTDFGSNWRLISEPNTPNSTVPHIPRPLFAYFSPTRFSATTSAFDVWIGSQGAGVTKVVVESP